MASKGSVFFFFLLLVFVSLVAGADSSAAPEEKMEEIRAFRRLFGKIQTSGDSLCGSIGATLGLTYCSNRCVNLKWDILNCGSCGKKCAFGYACCKGKCSNILFDWTNCGVCNKRCKKEGTCKYGLCNYA